MFVTIRFGYKQRKFFTTDCLMAYMIDQVWIVCKKQMLKKLDERSDFFKKEQDKNDKKKDPLERRIKDIEREIAIQAERKQKEEEQEQEEAPDKVMF